jgi:DNA topoisomerase-1
MKTKYLWLSAQSDLKTSSDVAKFDLARKLKKKIGQIEKYNLELLGSSDIKSRQIATSMYLIDKLAIRVGNEKSEDEADTVGCSNLRVEHIEFHEGDTITLNFLGKDSVRYTNTIQVIPLVFSNLKKFIQSKSKDDQIFDLITSADINKYLQSLMKNLTAKVFRTYNASNLFQKELNKITKKYEGLLIQPNPSDPSKSIPIINQAQLKEILDDFSKANAKVARMMNHQKNISQGYKKSVDKVNENLAKLKKKLGSVRRSSKKSSTKSNKIDKIKILIAKSKSKLEFVKEMKNISLGTSKANYIDPRITVSFMKKFNIDVDKIFSKALQEKFKWAFTVDTEYKF